LGLIHSTTAAAAVAWGIIIAALGLIGGLLVDVHVAVSDDGRTLEIIEGQGALMRAYEDLRRTEGATFIQAIWATRYPSAEIESYFAAERADLLRSGNLRIERLIAADVLDTDVMSKLSRHAHELSNLTLWEIEPVVLECNLCEYIR
jgi:hypothetical protein